MKKLMAILVFAGVLSVPSAVFAEASWYGSLRGGVELGKDETNFYDGGSRWGIKGSAEAGEGLTAVYQFEHKFSTTNAGMTGGEKPKDGEALKGGGRLAYVGLSGGFGSLTLGQIWSASYNHAGVIRDFPNWYTASDTSVRVGNALSYAVSNDVFSMQFDAIMDGEADTGKAVDQLEFGMTVNIGEFGKVAFAHTNKRDTMKTGVVTEAVPAGSPTPAVPAKYQFNTAAAGADPVWVNVEKVDVWVTEAYRDEVDTSDPPARVNVNEDGEFIADALPEITNPDGGDTYYALNSGGTRCGSANDGSDKCVAVPIYRQTVKTAEVLGTDGSIATASTTTITVRTSAELVEGTGTDEIPGSPAEPAVMGKVLKDRGHKASHVSAEFGVGAVTAALGYSESKMNGSSGKSKTTFIGAKGGIGDTGLNWGAFSRVKKMANGTETKPWTVGLSKTLGGGAWTYVEHGNDGNDGSTVIGLGISF